MPLVFKYHSPGNEAEEPGYVDLGDEVVRWGDFAVMQYAQTGETAQSGVELDDPDGALDIVGLRAFSIYESSAPSNSQLIGVFRVADRTVRRMESFGSNASLSRVWSVDLMDANWYLANRILVDADSNRPEETGGDRLRWLLRYADHVYFNDFGHCDYPTTNMDANDYRGQTAKDVLADISAATGYNFWLEVNEARNKQELFFQKPSSTEYASTIRISNDFADVDGTTTFAPNMDAELRRSPDKIAFGVYVPYAKGSVYVRNQATGAAFAKVDKTAPNSNIKKATTARNYGTRFLNDNNEEEDRISCWIIVPEAQVNDLRAGHLTSVKFTHFPGYEDFVLVRVLHRTITQDPAYAGSGYYRLDLELSPLGVTPVACSTSLLTAVSQTHSVTGSDGTESWAASDPALSGDVVLFGGFVANNYHTPDSHDAHFLSGMTEVYAANLRGVLSGWDHPTWALGYAIPASWPHAIEASYTESGIGSTGACFGSAAVVLVGSSPVQSSSGKKTSSEGALHLTLDSAPTAGNMLVMMVVRRTGTAYEPDDLLPNTGWSRISAVQAVSDAGEPGDGLGIYVRCVQSGDTDTYGIGNSGSSGHGVLLMEWDAQ